MPHTHDKGTKVSSGIMTFSGRADQTLKQAWEWLENKEEVQVALGFIRVKGEAWTRVLCTSQGFVVWTSLPEPREDTSCLMDDWKVSRFF
jgi:hypothetical protein